MQLQSVVIDTMILISNNFDISLCIELRIRGRGLPLICGEVQAGQK